MISLQQFLTEERNHRLRGKDVLIQEIKRIFEAEPDLFCLAVTRQSTYDDEGYSFGGLRSPVHGGHYEGWDSYAVNGHDYGEIYGHDEGYDLPSKELHDRVGALLRGLGEDTLDALLGAWGSFQVTRDGDTFRLEVLDIDYH